MGGVVTVTLSTGGPLGIGPKYFSSSARSFAGSKSPAIAMLALFGV